MIIDFLKNEPKTTGQKLIDSFNLNHFGKKAVVIQKVLSSSKNIYIITYDSLYKNRIITLNDLRRVKGNQMYFLKLSSDIIGHKKLKLTMPLYLYQFNKKIPSSSYVMTRDLMGRERFRNESLFESFYYMDNTLIKFED